MHRQGQLSVVFSRIFVYCRALHSPAHLSKPYPQGFAFIWITQSTKQSENFLNLPSGVPNYCQCICRFQVSPHYVLEQRALKLPAISRTVCIDSAPAALEGSARLRQYPPGDRETKVFQLSGIIVLLKFDIPKYNPVAAHAAGQAKLGAHCCYRKFRVFQPHKTTVSPRSRQTLFLGTKVLRCSATRYRATIPSVPKRATL